MACLLNGAVNFCSQCGAKVVVRVPHGDHLPRYICDRCGTVHYQNPKLVTGCIAEWEGRVLLCRRAIEPRLGMWTLPAGFMENNETTAQAATRETREEANAELEDLRLYALFNLPHISQVYVMFRGGLKGGQASAGAESLEVDLFCEAQIPWDELAFPVICESLRLYFEDRRRGRFEMHMGDIVRGADRKVRIQHY
jgi:ADP-ribose pyrophosphatase YjhB (NUDIX family)